MEVDEDDDFYAPEESEPPHAEEKPTESAPRAEVKAEQEDGDLEEGEEEDEAVDESEDSVRLEHSTGLTVVIANNHIGHRHYHRKEGWNQSYSSNVCAACSMKVQANLSLVNHGITTYATSHKGLLPAM